MTDYRFINDGKHSALLNKQYHHRSRNHNNRGCNRMLGKNLDIGWKR
ncbi:MAG: hypothetical protein MRK00_09675 [Nitrosomonas sp.]|nr:hypothetical protein [Nitrosomonas sp.]